MEPSDLAELASQISSLLPIDCLRILEASDCLWCSRLLLQSVDRAAKKSEKSVEMHQLCSSQLDFVKIVDNNRKKRQKCVSSADKDKVTFCLSALDFDGIKFKIKT